MKVNLTPTAVDGVEADQPLLPLQDFQERVIAVGAAFVHGDGRRLVSDDEVVAHGDEADGAPSAARWLVPVGVVADDVAVLQARRRRDRPARPCPA